MPISYDETLMALGWMRGIPLEFTLQRVSPPVEKEEHDTLKRELQRVAKQGKPCVG